MAKNLTERNNHFKNIQGKSKGYCKTIRSEQNVGFEYHQKLQDWGCGKKAGHHWTAQIPELIKSTREKLGRNPKRPLRNMAKVMNVSIRTILVIHNKNLKMSPDKCQKKLLFSASSVEKWQARCQALCEYILAGTLLNTVFRFEEKFHVEQYFNSKNNWIWRQ